MKRLVYLFPFLIAVLAPVILMGAYPGTKAAFLNLAQSWTATQTFDTTHTVTGLPNPSGASDAANKAYVDNVAAGLNPAVAVQAATTAAGNTSGLTYFNGVSGIGATLTGANNTALTVDGFTFTALGQRLLVKNDTQSPSGAFNGVYYVTQVQASLLPLVLTRALDYDQSSDINNTGAIPVVNGTVNASTSWLLTSSVTTVGTDPLTYTQFTINPTTVMTTNTIQTVTAAKSFTDADFILLGASSGSSTVKAPSTGGGTATLPAGSGTLVYTDPLQVISSTGNTFTGPTGYAVCTTTCTITPPAPVAGYQFCVMNDDNVATVITLGAIGSSASYENTARTAYGTAGTGTFVSGGAVGDMVCIVGRDSTHYLTTTFKGTWTAS